MTLPLNFIFGQNDSIVEVSAGTETLVTEEPVVENVNPYKGILESRQFVFNIKSILRGLLGLVSLLLIAFLFSTNRRKINWKTVGIALLMQLLIALGILTVPAVQTLFEIFGKAFVVVLDWTKAGSNFLFGSLMDQNKFGYVFALQILPTIIFFSALTSLLFYWGILQKVVWVMAWVFTKLMNLSGAESLSTTGNILLGYFAEGCMGHGLGLHQADEPLGGRKPVNNR